MKYKTRDETFRVRGLTRAERDNDAGVMASISEEERHAEEEYAREHGSPDFLVEVSRVANGWWTRAEITALRDRLSTVLEES